MYVSLRKRGGKSIAPRHGEMSCNPKTQEEFDALAMDFISSLDAAESTRQTYRKSIDIFFEWVSMQGKPMEEFNSLDILSYKDTLLAENKSALTVNLYLSVVRKFYKWASSNDIMDDVASSVGSVRTNRETFRKMHLDSEEGARLLEESALPKEVKARSRRMSERLSGTEEMIAARNYAMLNLMLRAGLRTIEVSRADVGDIVKKKGRRVLLVCGKGHSDKDDFVILTDEAYDPIRRYLKFRPGAKAAEPLFSCAGLDSEGRRMSPRRIQAICKECLRAIGLDGHEYSAHSLRHTTGTQILLNGGTMFDVQHVLRHSSPATSQLYVNTIMEEKRLADASESLLDKSFKEQ